MDMQSLLTFAIVAIFWAFVTLLTFPVISLMERSLTISLAQSPILS